MKTLSWIGLGLVVLVLALLLRGSLSSPPAQSLPPNPVLALTLPDLVGHQQNLAQWHGKVIMVNFWATWCGPCRDEMPELSEFQRRHPEVQLVGIGIDNPERIRQFAAQHPVSYPLLMGTEEIMNLTRKMGNAMDAFPFTLVFNAQGQVVESFMGRIVIEDLDRALAKAKASS